MEIEILRCGNCECEYNLTNRLPRILMSCAHTICSVCIANLIEPNGELSCPFDNITQILGKRGVEACLVEPTFKRLLELKNERNVCEEHNEEFTFLCTDDEVKICDSCIHESKHRDHNIKSLKKIKLETKTKSTKLGAALKGYEDYHREIESMLKQSEDLSINVIKDNLEELGAIITSRKEELIAKAKSFFEAERRRLNEVLEYNSIKICALDKVVEEIPNGREDFNFMEEEELLRTIKKIKDKLVEQQTQNMKFIVEEISTFLEKSLSTQKETFNQLEASLSELTSKLNMTSPKESKDSTRCETDSISGSPDSNGLIKVESEGEYLVISAQENPTHIDYDKDLIATLEQWKLAENVCLKLTDHTFLEKNMNKFFTAWKTFQKLSCLKVDFRIESTPTELLLSVLPVVFSKQRGLRKISVNLDHCPMKDNFMNTLFKNNLSQMVDLESLTINLRSTKVSDQSLQAFAKYALSSMEYLNKFQVSLCQTLISDCGVIEMLKQVKDMKKFALDLDDTKVTDKTIEVFVKNVLPLMKTLEELELCLSKTSLTDKSVNKLLSNIPNIQSLFLSLDSINVSNKSLESFVKKALPFMDSINSFSMSLRGSKVSDQGVFQLLSEMRALKTFKLYLGSTKVTNNILQAFQKNIKGFSLNDLEDFELNLRATSITDEGMFQMFTSMPKVQTFSMSLAETQITDRTLIAFVYKALHTMRSLKHLRLILWETQVTDEGVKNVLSIIKNIKKLELGLQGTKVTDKAIDAFIEIIPTMKNLENFEIALEGTSVSQKKVIQLEEIRRSLLLNH